MSEVSGKRIFKRFVHIFECSDLICPSLLADSGLWWLAAVLRLICGGVGFHAARFGVCASINALEVLRFTDHLRGHEPIRPRSDREMK